MEAGRSRQRQWMLPIVFYSRMRDGVTGLDVSTGPGNKYRLSTSASERSPSLVSDTLHMHYRTQDLACTALSHHCIPHKGKAARADG